MSGDSKTDSKFTRGIDFPSSSMTNSYPFDAQQLAFPSVPQSPPLPHTGVHDSKTSVEIIEGSNFPSSSMETLYLFDGRQLGPRSQPLPHVYRPCLPDTTPSSAQRSQPQIHCSALQAHAQQYLEHLEKITGHGVINHVKSSSLSKKASEKRRTRTKFALCPVEGCDTSFTRTHNINGENSSSTALVTTFSFSFDTYVQVISIIILATCHMYVTRNIATTALHIRSALIDTRNMHTVIPLSQANGVKIKAKAWGGQRRSLS